MIDEALSPFATDRQWELYCAVQEHGEIERHRVTPLMLEAA